MKLPSRQLAQHLGRALAPVYLVAGEEPLLVGEDLERIRSAARAKGFDERELHVVDRGFDWNALAAGMDNMSLFSSRRIVELRMSSARPGDKGAAAIRAFCERPDPDRVLLIGVFAKLESSIARSAWVKSIEKAGAVVQIWPLEPSALPAWIGARAKAAGIALTRDAVELVAERVEGNLLAADQEIRKLALTAEGATLDAQAIREAVANSARFDVFELSDAVLRGEAQRSMQILDGLRGEGVQPVLVSWAMSRDIGLLAKLGFAVSRGERLDAVMGRLGVWRRQQPLLRAALGRFKWAELCALVIQAANVDAVIKGARHGRPWDALTQLVVAVLEPSRARAPAGF